MTLPAEAADFAADVVRSVTLSCLLAMDFVPGSRPPPVAEMVRNELPRVLTVRSVLADVPRLRASLGTFAFADELERLPPAEALRAYASRAATVGALDAAGRLIRERGHRDGILAALKYRRKPPTATDERVADLTAAVAGVLGVPAPGFGGVLEDYSAVHSEIA